MSHVDSIKAAASRLSRGGLDGGDKQTISGMTLGEIGEEFGISYDLLAGMVEILNMAEVHGRMNERRDLLERSKREGERDVVRLIGKDTRWEN